VTVKEITSSCHIQSKGTATGLKDAGGGGRRRSSDYFDAAFYAVHAPKNCHIHKESSYSALFSESTTLNPEQANATVKDASFTSNPPYVGAGGSVVG
jgi:hypothetical protein